MFQTSNSKLTAVVCSVVVLLAAPACVADIITFNYTATVDSSVGGPGGTFPGISISDAVAGTFTLNDASTSFEPYNALTPHSMTAMVTPSGGAAPIVFAAVGDGGTDVKDDHALFKDQFRRNQRISLAEDTTELVLTLQDNSAGAFSSEDHDLDFPALFDAGFFTDEASDIASISFTNEDTGAQWFANLNSLEVATVPEPSSLGFCGICCAGVLTYLRRKSGNR